MKILHISAYGLRGGCEKNCYHFIRGDNENAHDLVVLGQEGPMTSDWRSLGIKVDHLDILKENIMVFRKVLRNYLKQRCYDFVICWSTIRLPLQLNSLNGVTDNIRVYLGNPVGKGYKPFKDQVLGLFFPSKGTVVLMACSTYTSQSYRNSTYYSRFAVSVSLNPVALANNGIGPEGSKHPFKMGMVARLDPIKDHQTIIRGFQKIRKLIPQSELHIVGEGILHDQLTDLSRELGIENSIIFHGDVEDVYKHLRQWNLFVYATTTEEGLGSAVAEAMANGLPCVLSDLPMLRELAPDEDLVTWFPAGNSDAFAESVLVLYGNEDLRKRLGENGFRHAQKNFSTRRFIYDYLYSG